MLKERIESVFPLSHMQGALLFHKLQAERDQGFLQLSCSLVGELDSVLFEGAWQLAIERHSVLRTTLHWEGISQPVQVVQPPMKPLFEYHDWREIEEEDIEQYFHQFKREDLLRELPLTKGPVSRFQLIQIKDESYYFLWSFHHILLDGWSSMIILEDVMEYYESLVEDRKPGLSSIPSYRDYLYWKSLQDHPSEEAYWKAALEGFERPLLVGKRGSPSSRSLGEEAFQTHRVQLSQELSTSVKEQARELGISLNTLLQGFWALVMSKWFSTTDVVYGLTVSGRAGDFPGINQMSQAMMNLVPARVKLELKETLATHLRAEQQNLAQLSSFESTALSQIQSWINWPSQHPMFDCLLVFQGFPWEVLQKGKLSLSKVEGKAVSVFPLTLLINPQQDIEFSFRYIEEQVEETHVHWAGTQLLKLLEEFFLHKQATIGELLEGMDSSPLQIPFGIPENSEASKKEMDLAVSSSEILLERIWKRVLGLPALSVTDNFFEIGGSSILAVQVMAEINEQFQLKLAPVSLLTHPTIRELAPLLQEENQEHWASLVAVQPKGSRPPLFLLHDIGGDIFIYRDLALFLGEEQPLYAFQAKGMDGEESTLETVSDLADYYIAEIKRLYPNGPFLLGGTSFGGLVAYEMGRKLIEAGEKVALLALFDTYPYRGPFSYGNEGSPARLKWLEKLDIHVGRWLVKGTKSRIKHYRSKGKKFLWKKLPFLTYKEVIPPERNQRIWDANARAIKNYYQEPYHGRITQFIATEHYARFYQDVRLGWHAYALKGLEIHLVPGDHLTMMYPPNVEVLAKELGKCIDRVIEEREEFRNF